MRQANSLDFEGDIPANPVEVVGHILRLVVEPPPNDDFADLLAALDNIPAVK